MSVTASSPTSAAHLAEANPSAANTPDAKTRQGMARLYAVLAGLYLAQGIPTYLLLVALPPLMREAGASRTAIGLFSLLMLPLVLKFAVAPYVDRHKLMPRIGHRRGWIVPTQALVSLAIAAMAFFDPSEALPLFGLGLFITLLSSLQDIATDGYAVRHLKGGARAIGNAVQAGAVALGVIIGGTLVLVLVQQIGWTPTILIVALLSLLPLLATLFMAEEQEGVEKADRPRPSLAAFFRRPQAWLILGFALSYRASEGLVRGMEGPYLVDIQVPTAWIGYLSGTSAATAGLAGAMLAALIIRRLGLGPTLLLLGGLRSLCFLAFSLNAFGLAPGIAVALAASGFQTLIRYMELVAIYSFFMKSASDDQPGTDFTLLACAELVVYIIGTSLAGIIADRVGYAWLFSLATVISVLGIALSLIMLRRLKPPAEPAV